MAESRSIEAVRVVLYEPQNTINIAATVRAMKNFGVKDVVLVRPVEYTAYRLEGIAHGTLDIIERIRNVSTLDEALGDTVYVAAFTARRRRTKWKVGTPRQAAAELMERATEGTVALLFGREDDGLPNEALERAHLHVTIPTTEHASLNLAQAVVVALYELHLAAGTAGRRIGPPRKDAPPATAAEFERLFKDQERALEAVDFFKTRFRDHIMRTARSLGLRMEPDAREIMLVRAMWIEVVRAMNRFRKMAGLPQVEQGELQEIEEGQPDHPHSEPPLDADATGRQL